LGWTDCTLSCGFPAPRLIPSTTHNATTHTHTTQPGRTVNFSAPTLEGSATWYRPDLAQSPDLFAMLLTRDGCDKRPPASQEDTFEPFCTMVPETTLNTTEFVFVVQRAYLNPVTKIGPDPAEMLVPRVLVFETPGMGEVEEQQQQEEAVAAAAWTQEA
jgi:hypothetical protein